jgi:hypothetical protein
MLKTTLMAAAALSFVALGTPTAYAGKGGGGGGGHHGGGGGGGGHHGGGGGGGHHGGGGGGGHHGGGGGGGHHGGGGGHHGHHNKWGKSHFWLGYNWYPSCHYETKKVRIKVRDRWGRPYFKRVWRDVKVCY